MALAIGLEKSLQKFIWVLRDADRGDVFTSEGRKVQLPEGYEERIKGRGIIVRDWAAQLEILAHSSTDGFMSHCGWNSCMESMSFGVPIAARPMHSDQPRNSQLVTKGNGNDNGMNYGYHLLDRNN
ncbi:zeatin O-glucosyltransferase-like [Capsicum annuum]|uniref:zeatin O-glucosyltransferase-like n=1 Tax=Capsicum annuum TaxID=4072 RepID=UPI001FB0EDD6|nr:zeatin O-glucosyltransferase-like [Capsicum annuum]XP_047268870.1 zeatin O-glucosyltransferase-like [Capsicum annuum]